MRRRPEMEGSGKYMEETAADSRQWAVFSLWVRLLKPECCEVLHRVSNLTGRYHFEDLGIDGRIILEWILQT
jgi:hypothetical protein